MTTDSSGKDTWDNVKEQLTPTDTEEAVNQLNVMDSAEVLYNDNTELNWDKDLKSNYRDLIQAFGGEENLNQYHDIGAFGVTLAVEQDEEPIFVVYAEQEKYRQIKERIRGLATPL